MESDSVCDHTSDYEITKLENRFSSSWFALAITSLWKVIIQLPLFGEVLRGLAMGHNTKPNTVQSARTVV